MADRWRVVYGVTAVSRTDFSLRGRRRRPRPGSPPLEHTLTPSPPPPGGVCTQHHHHQHHQQHHGHDCYYYHRPDSNGPALYRFCVDLTGRIWCAFNAKSCTPLWRCWPSRCCYQGTSYRIDRHRYSTTRLVVISGTGAVMVENWHTPHNPR